jgi:phospholipase/carboxylesterase
MHNQTHLEPAMPDLSLVIQEPAEQAAQLILLCHAAGADAASLLPLGERLCEAFPQATIVSLQADTPAATPKGFEWFAMPVGLSDQDRVARVAQALPTLQAAVRDWQERSGVSTAATALIGISQGAEMVLELSKLQPMLASRVIAIGGRFTTLPDEAPAVTTTHFLHGKDDSLNHYSHSVIAAHHLRDMGCDITAEVVPFVNQNLHPDVVELAITKLSTHIPHHWLAAAQEGVPPPPSLQH